MISGVLVPLIVIALICVVIGIIIMYKTRKICNFTVNVFLAPETEEDLADNKMIFKVGTTLCPFKDDADLHADPFLFVKDGYLYLFMEEAYLGEPLQGKIKAFRTQNLKRWENLGVVYQTDCHLSFPFVFEDGDDVYMIPESGDKGKIVLLKADHFPYDWHEEALLLEGKKYLDSHVVKRNNKWYLFTNPSEDTLEIFVSESLSGQWRPHKGNPVVTGWDKARSGGSIIDTGKALYRIGQDCTGKYGSNIGIFLIKVLTPDEYVEEPYIPKVHTRHYAWNCIGGHHLNKVCFNGRQVVVMDGLAPMSRWNRLMFYIIYFYKVRILHRLK